MRLARHTSTGWLVLLLLMLSQAANHETRYISSLTLLNPWLSSCDLTQPSPPDLQGSCSTTMISEFPGPPKNCSSPCRHTKTTSSSTITSSSSSSISRNSNDNTTQCLDYLNESHKMELCRDKTGRDSVRLRHCCEHSVANSLSDDVFSDQEKCHQAVQALIDIDNLAARLSCEFAEILTRYDCGQTYSVNSKCADCQEAYRQWVCASLVPHWTRGRHRVKPCRSTCQRVEQKCPFFLPGDRAPSYPTQYAGEPTFLCLDPNIPETGQQLQRSVYSSSCCFEHCNGHNLCIASAGDCVNTRHNSAPAGEHCTSGNTVISSSCSHTTSGTNTGQLNVILFGIILIGHLLLDRRSRKRTTISCK